MRLNRIRTEIYSPIWIFVVALAIRAIPEFLSGTYPAGYDMLAGYAPSVLALPDNYPMKCFGWAGSPLAVYMLWGLWTVTHLDLFALLKVAGPVFYASFAASFYYLVSGGLGWNKKKSFATALLFLMQPAILRIGWDQLREELGFVLLFVLLGRNNCQLLSPLGKKSLMMVALSLLLVWSHQLVAVLLFVIVFWQAASEFARKSLNHLESLICFLPAAILFVAQLYLQYSVNDISPHFVPIALPSGTNFFAFTNYFLSDPRFIGANYLLILGSVFLLSLFSVIPLAPIAIRGFFKDRVFAPMMLWLLIASYSILVTPWFAISYYWWWILLLPIPLTVFFVHGLDRRWNISDGRFSRKALVGPLLLGVLAVSYATSTVNFGRVSSSFPNLGIGYMPSGLVESCVSYDSIPDIKTAFTWVNENLARDSIVIVHENFQGFASMYSRSDLKIHIAPPLLTLSQVLQVANIHRTMAYGVYFTNAIGRYGNLTILQEFGEIAVCSVLIV